MATASVIGTGGMLLPVVNAAADQPRTAAADLDPAGIAKFTQKMPLAPVLQPYLTTSTTSYYNMTLKDATKEIVPGLTTPLRTFNGSFPGPVIKAESGRRVVVKQTNTLANPTSIHLHGGHVPQDSDGSPMDLIAAGGGTKTYTYPNTQPHANLWFHDHAHHLESENVFRGLTATYLLTDDTERRLGLPSGAYDVPVALRDARFAQNGELVYEMGDFQHRNVILANGKAWPFFEVAARKYRFRLYNTANMRFFDLRLSDGSELVQIGTDGGLLAAPHHTNAVSITPGERADVVIDFSRFPVGTTVELVNKAFAPGEPEDLIGRVLQFRVNRTAADDSVVPAALRTLPPLAVPTVNRTIELRMDETGAPSDMAYIDGKTYDMDRIDTEIAYGATEVWTVKNVNQFVPHNFHMHLVQFRVLERNGQPVTAGAETGLKDTVALMPGETVKLQATFTGYRGTYVYHCHMFDHGAMGMMANMRIS
ncbi:multicopper oxidase family protein [Streptomyces sp. NBC_00249]|uniref:multicopper oxidase family protein n=1 Tax=Streptomyces sp. NBC_00249 TaxID=2975690 RepID=UPI0022529AA8|nr:multicopper oxidase family protein [Streptomyces sp. NBC_00249]MCX5192559.1 multicopper oxidase family protein [Streptomyces sp. NBC_00249]